MAEVAPNLGDKVFILRPTYSTPPLCSLNDLRTVYTLDDLYDFHEILDMRDALADKVAEASDKD